MKVEVVKPEPVENKVVIELSESEASTLRRILSYAYSDDDNTLVESGMRELHNHLITCNTGAFYVGLTGNGIRVYNGLAEW